MYRVLLVDDHDVVRRGLRAIFEDRFSAISVAEAANAEQALAALTQTFDVVVLDFEMPGRSGIDLLVEIKHRAPTLPVLMLSLHGEDQFAVRALRAGAAGCLSKTASPEQIVTAFERVASGHRYVSDALAERLADQLVGKPDAPHDRLSNREFDVLRSIASGMAVGEIAAAMCLSVKTVATYRTRLLEKMGLSSNAELTRYAIENGLV